MTIKQHGGVFGRNPKFNNVEAESLTIAGNAVPDASTILVDGDIGSTVQGYDADTAKYDDVTANFTGTLQNGGSDVLVDTDIGSSVQAYDADTAKLDAAQTWTAAQTFNENLIFESGNGIDFSATAGTGTSELFDDYEEGTWTPAFSGGDYSFTYNKQKGSYTKIGNRVFIDCVVYMHPTIAPSGSVDGNLSITGLPYTFNKQNDVEVVGGIAHFKQLFLSAIESLAARLGDGGTSFLLYDTLATNYPELNYVQASDVTANSRIRIQFSYPTNG